MKIAPVPLNLHGKNKSLVALGSYLVNAVGGYNDCHTWNPAAAPDGSYGIGGDPFRGHPKKIALKFYLSGGRLFFTAPYPIALNGCVISRNITPFEDGKPAGLTFEEFVHVIRTGQGPGRFARSSALAAGDAVACLSRYARYD